MSLICKTLVLVENPETLKIVARAFPHPKYELEFVDTPEEASARALSNRMDLFIVDSGLAGNELIETVRRYMPTLYLEAEYTQIAERDGVLDEESDRMRAVAEKLLRKNYINWIVDALEYAS
jgi:DNA-binding response OmpR family regulator